MVPSGGKCGKFCWILLMSDESDRKSNGHYYIRRIFWWWCIITHYIKDKFFRNVCLIHLRSFSWVRYFRFSPPFWSFIFILVPTFILFMAGVLTIWTMTVCPVQTIIGDMSFTATQLAAMRFLICFLMRSCSPGLWFCNPFDERLLGLFCKLFCMMWCDGRVCIFYLLYIGFPCLLISILWNDKSYELLWAHHLLWIKSE